MPGSLSCWGARVCLWAARTEGRSSSSIQQRAGQALPSCHLTSRGTVFYHHNRSRESSVARPSPTSSLKIPGIMFPRPHWTSEAPNQELPTSLSEMMVVPSKRHVCQAPHSLLSAR